MVSMQQLEELEVRVVKALQLIGDLRSENAKLESDNEGLKGEIEEVKLTLEEKDQEVAKIKAELDEATRELDEIRDRGSVLEKKVVGLLSKLDVIQGADASSVEVPVYSDSDSSTLITEPAAEGDTADVQNADDFIMIVDDEESDAGQMKGDDIVLLDDNDGIKSNDLGSIDDDFVVIDDMDDEKKEI